MNKIDTIKIKSKDLSFEADLLWELAPKTCQAVIDILPLEINLIHVKWSGFGVWADLGDIKVEEIPYENNTIYFSAGQIMFYPGFESMKELLIPYDNVAFASKAGLHSANHFATVKNPEKLSELGRRTVEDGKQPVIFEI